MEVKVEVKKEVKVGVKVEVRNLKAWSLFVVLTVCMAVSSVSCSSKSGSTSSRPTIDRIELRGTLLIGTTGDYRPLSFCEADGTLRRLHDKYGLIYSY